MEITESRIREKFVHLIEVIYSEGYWEGNAFISEKKDDLLDNLNWISCYVSGLFYFGVIGDNSYWSMRSFMSRLREAVLDDNFEWFNELYCSRRELL